MTPTYLNPLPSPFPLVELKEDQHIQLFINPPYQAGSSCPTFFNTTQYQRDSEQQHEQKVYKCISHDESSDHQVLTSSSSLWASMADEYSSIGHKFSVCKREDGDYIKSEHGSVKWMSSKMRVMQKMMNSNCPGAENSITTEQNLHNHHQHGNNGEINFSDNSNNTTIRVCADCNTTKTPLWRSGPRGPKSLCNACGIRQRKARRAMAAAAAAAAAANGTELDAAEASFTKTNNIKVISKEKKSRTGHVTQFNKKHCKQLSRPSDQTKKKLCFEDFALSLSKNPSFHRVFPQDEEEGAILLMALSCGLVHS